MSSSSLTEQKTMNMMENALRSTDSNADRTRLCVSVCLCEFPNDRKFLL